MADNVTIPATGSGDATPKIATDDVGAIHYQRVKLDGGGNGLTVPFVAGQQAMAASLPVVVASDQPAIPISGTVTTGGLTDTQLRATPVPVSGTVAVTSATLATEATLSTLNSKVTAVNTGAVVVSSSALPTLAATSTKQSDGTQKTQLVDGSGNVIAATSNALNVAITSGGSGGGPATIADGADVTEGAIADAAVVTDTTGTLSGKLRGLVKWAFERMPASLGQKVKTASLPVVLASDSDALPVTGPLTDTQLRASAVPVSAAVLPLPSGAATETTLGTRLTESDFDAKIGSLTETAPGTDTASSGLNGRLQRIAQRLTSLITALGSPFQAGGSIGNTSFGATQATASSLNATVVGSGAAGTAATGVVTVQGIASMTKLLVTPDSVALPANQSVNVAQLAGTTAATNSGNKDAGTLRVVIATDQVAMTNAQPANITQVAGATISQGHGTAATAIRVELPTDGTGVIATVGAVTEITNALPTGDNFIGYAALNNNYTNLTNLTTTNFSGLTTGNAWQSVAIDAGGSQDIHFEFQTVGAAGSTLYVDFYIAETLSNGTVYTDGATGTEGTFTAANRKNSRYLGSMLCNGTSAVQACMKLSDIFAVIPKKFAIIAINNSGGTISATGGNTVFDWAHVN